MLKQIMYKMSVGYVVFVIVGFLGGLFCPYDSKITGYANDYIGGGFVYSYRHDYDSMEKLLFISVPIVVVAIILCIIYSYLDKEEIEFWKK